MVITSEVLAADWINVQNKKVSSRIKTRESLIRTVCGAQFQTDGAENQKVCLEKSFLMKGWTSSRMPHEQNLAADMFCDLAV